MANSKKHDLDQLIRETLEEKMNNMPSPLLTVDEAWEKLNGRKVIHASRKRRFPKKVLAAIASILLILGIASYPQQGSAFSRWSEMFSKAQGSVVQLFGSSEGPSQGKGNVVSGGPDYAVIEGADLLSEQLSLEEAQEVASFPIIVPVVPPEFILDQVTVLRKDDQQSNEIILNFVGNKRGLTITEKVLAGNFAFGSTMDSDDTKVEEVTIHGQQAFLATYKNGVSSLTWMTQMHFIEIEGILTKEEILAIANSM